MRDDSSPLDEPGPVRVVGRRRPPAPLCPAFDTKAQAREWRRAFPTPFVPRGVYRFESHESADRWLWEVITRPRDGETPAPPVPNPRAPKSRRSA